MEIDKLKKKYFYYCCDSNSMFRDCALGNLDEVISLLNINSFEWTKEFQKNLERKIYESCTKLEFCTYYGEYMLSSKSHEDFYNLTKIIFKFITEEIIIFEELFIYFYELIFFTKCASFNASFMKGKSLFEYYKSIDDRKFKELIDMSKKVLSKDNFYSNQYKEARTIISLF